MARLSEQIMDYVCTMKMENKHDTPCAVLSSGQWTIVFTKPVLTFVDGKVSTDNIKIFKLGLYKNHADELFNLLPYSILVKEVPFPLRPTQIKDYIDIGSISAAFYGVHVHCEETGSPFLGPKPQILIYPVLILQRHDGVFATVIDKNEHSPLEYATNDEVNTKDLTTHLHFIATRLQELLCICEKELARKLTVSTIENFPGFPPDSPYGINNTPLMVKRIKGPLNNWLVVTGTEKHYLRYTTLIESCRFHSWVECHSESNANGTSAINIRSTNPRIIFIDNETHHCAHQIVYDRRRQHCHISPIDDRVCCQACHYFNLCWSQVEQEKLPCGK